MDSETLNLLTIPLFTGAIGYATNSTGVWMLFYPIRFRGVRVPGLRPLANLLPRRVQQIPGVMQGGLGWQGIVPSRAAKMGSIAVDKGIAKLGGAGDFYQRLDSEAVVEHVLASSRGEIRDVVERIMEREQPRLWHDLTPRVREAVHARVQEQLPEIVRAITAQIGDHVDQLLNVKLMVIRHIEETPELANRIFLEVDHTVTPLADPEFGRAQSRGIRDFVAARMREMDPADFSEMLRTAMREDEWLLYLHGAVLGFGAGLLHLAIFG